MVARWAASDRRPRRNASRGEVCLGRDSNLSSGLPASGALSSLEFRERSGVSPRFSKCLREVGLLQLLLREILPRLAHRSQRFAQWSKGSGLDARAGSATAYALFAPRLVQLGIQLAWSRCDLGWVVRECARSSTRVASTPMSGAISESPLMPPLGVPLRCMDLASMLFPVGPISRKSLAHLLRKRSIKGTSPSGSGMFWEWMP